MIVIKISEKNVAGKFPFFQNELLIFQNELNGRLW